AAWRPPQAAGALQFGAPGISRGPDGRRHPGADRTAGDRARPACARHSARAARRAIRGCRPLRLPVVRRIEVRYRLGICDRRRPDPTGTRWAAADITAAAAGAREYTR